MYDLAGPTQSKDYAKLAWKAGYYQWLHKPLSDRAVEDQRLLVLIRQSYESSGRVYGAPRVFLDRREVGEHIDQRVWLVYEAHDTSAA